VDPSITSVLIVGAAGTAKTTIVQSLADIDRSIRSMTLPLNVTEERLVGGMDIEFAIQEGRKVRDPGILEKANGNILLMDQVNLFDESVVQTALAASEDGHYSLEREGLGTYVESKFLLVGMMDPREGGLPSHILDRFELCAFMDEIDDRAERAEIVKRRVDFEAKGSEFRDKYRQETDALCALVDLAKDRRRYVLCSDDHLDTISRLCLDLNAEGHRGDIAMAKTIKCIAALDLRDNVITDDLQKAAEICLQHRRNNTSRSGERERNGSDAPENRQNESVESPNDDTEMQGRMNDRTPPTEGEDDRIQGGEAKRDVYSVGDPFTIIHFLEDDHRLKIEKRRSGRRGTVISQNSSGRYVSFKLPNGKPHDIAFDATIRAAAPFQKNRRRGGRSFVIEPSDLREKVRTRKSGTTILFLVDASGSMGAKRRMGTVKGAIFSMLKDAYQKRDMVGLMTFADGSSPMILPPTKSIDLAYSKLRTIPTGGRTPLPLALNKATEFLCSPRMKDIKDIALVIVTDGRANVAVHDGDAFSQTLSIAHRMSSLPIRFVVVDSETGYPRMGKASMLSEALGGSYFRLEGLSADGMASSLNFVVHGAVRA
jgi:magnesium chelatase subunit D